MAPRSTLACIVVLVALALPVASAQVEELPSDPTDPFALIGYAEQTANEIGAGAQEALPREEAPTEEPAPEAEEPATHEHGAEHGEHAAEEPQRAPEEREEDLFLAPVLSPVSRFAPIPDTNVGPMPRIDIAFLTAAIDEVAPTPAPARETPAPAPRPVVSAPERAPEQNDAPAMPVPVLALAAATAVAAAGPATAGAMWERLKGLVLLVGLYSRIAKERLLDHGSRERLLDAIRAKPGQAVADLAERTGYPRNTVTYHLRVLEREGLVSSTRNGRNRLFFAPGSLPQRANADGFAALRHETTLAMARAIGANPGVDQKALCESVGLSPSLAHWHADRLVASGLVDKRREGRYVRYYPGAAFGLVQARSA